MQKMFITQKYLILMKQRNKRCVEIRNKKQKTKFFMSNKIKYFYKIRLNQINRKKIINFLLE